MSSFRQVRDCDPRSDLDLTCMKVADRLLSMTYCMPKEAEGPKRAAAAGPVVKLSINTRGRFPTFPVLGSMPFARLYMVCTQCTEDHVRRPAPSATHPLSSPAPCAALELQGLPRISPVQDQGLLR